MTTTVDNEPTVSRGAAGYALFLLFLSNLLNVADRSLLGIVVDPVRADLRLSDTQMSLVSGTAFVLFNLLVGIFIARWVDRANRKRILIAGVALWSAATAMTGLAQGFVSLALTRVLVGVGEATAFPVAISMIADLYNPVRRPRAIGIYQSGVFVGVVLGSIAAGVLAAAHGWRMMFLMCGGVGFVLVLLMLATMREPARVGLTSGAQLPSTGLWQQIASLLRIPGMSALALGTGIAAMPGGVLPVWAPTFLLRSHGVALADVGALIGPAVGIGGVLGTVGSGFLASYFAKRSGNEFGGLIVPLVALPLSVPFYALYCFAPSLTVTMMAAAIMNLLMASGLGPCLAAALALSPASSRAVCSTLMLIALGVIGGALAPLIVGMTSDGLAQSYGSESLRYAMATMLVAPLFGALFIGIAMRRGRNIARSTSGATDLVLTH